MTFIHQLWENAYVWNNKTFDITSDLFIISFYLKYINYYILMKLNNTNNLETNDINNQVPDNKFSKSEDILLNLKDSEVIEKELEELLKSIETLIRDNFLKKEYYENLADGTNPEIDNICNHSASDIENRVKEGKWILYMNPCISQTLYLINKLKKQFSHLSEKMDLCVEILKLSKLNINSVHAFISINVLNHEPIIIDYAHDNDVYIYQWSYTNKSSQAIKTESTHIIPVNSFSENDTIFDIAVKWHVLSEWDFDPSSQELHNDFFSWILNSRKEQLKTHNTEARFQHWQEKNKGVKIFNSLH